MINQFKTSNHNQGQIAILVLLASAVLLTLGLSASRKTITDTKIDTDEQLLKEAFNTAESGINNYLNDPNAKTYTDSSGNSAVVDVAPIGGNNNLSSDGIVPANALQLFWLVNHAADGSIPATPTYYPTGSTLTLSVDSTFTGALKIDYYYKNGAVYSVTRSGLNFHNTTDTVTGYPNTPNKSTTITATNSPLLLVVTPIGAPTRLTLTGPAAFPLQGEDITSVGTATNGVKTQIKTRNIYQIPYFFFESITAGNRIN
jgi:hypothetical protein